MHLSENNQHWNKVNKYVFKHWNSMNTWIRYKREIKLWFRSVTVHWYLGDYYFFGINICGVRMSRMLLRFEIDFSFQKWLVSLSMWRAQRHLPLSEFKSVPYFNKSLCKHKIRCKKFSFTLKESLFYLSHAYRRSFWSNWLFWRFKFSVLRYMIFFLNFLCPTEILTFSNFLTKICLERPKNKLLNIDKYCL